MPRLRDTRTDVVVSVDDATAVTLGSAYEPVESDKKAGTKKVTARKPERVLSAKQTDAFEKNTK